MSYLMDFESAANVRDDDNVMTYEDAFQLVCDSKSLLYLFGLRLDYRYVLTQPLTSSRHPQHATASGSDMASAMHAMLTAVPRVQ